MANEKYLGTKDTKSCVSTARSFDLFYQYLLCNTSLDI